MKYIHFLMKLSQAGSVTTLMCGRVQSEKHSLDITIKYEGSIKKGNVNIIYMLNFILWQKEF